MKEKNTILTDFKTDVNLFGDLRRARKNGSEVQIQRMIQVPYINAGPGFLDTVEGCTLMHCERDIFERILEVFSGLPYEQKRCLAFAPKDGEFISRAQFWINTLKPVLTARQYHIAIDAILHWYIHIKAINIVEKAA